MANYVKFKLPRARKVSDFIVYPFTAEDESIKLQSDNHCMIVFVGGENKGKTLQSKRFAQYPRFEYCDPRNGGNVIDTPKEITDQLELILKNPTGKIITL
jgi:hypothetical protein